MKDDSIISLEIQYMKEQAIKIENALEKHYTHDDERWTTLSKEIKDWFKDLKEEYDKRFASKWVETVSITCIWAIVWWVIYIALNK